MTLLDRIDEWLVPVIVALGGGVTAQAAGKALWQWFTGKPQRERDAILTERKRADAAERETERERRLRIQWQELAARYRFELIGAGIEPQATWPTDPPTKEIPV